MRMQPKNRLLFAALVAMLGVQVEASSTRAQDSGESSSFDFFNDSAGHDGGDPDEMVPECMTCGTMIMVSPSGRPILKAAGDAPAVASMEDETTLDFEADRPDYVDEGPSPVITLLDTDAEGIEVSSTTEVMVTKAKGGRARVRTKGKFKVKPGKRSLFPKKGDALACDPAKPYNKKQKGWVKVRVSSHYKTKKGVKRTSKAKTVHMCVVQPPSEPTTCSLSCGTGGSCDHSYTKGVWTELCGCKAGYKFDPKAKACVDVNECTAVKSTPCGKGSTCTNSPGSYACTCPMGQAISARGCVKAPPACATCGANSTCLQTFTSASCVCSPGYRPGAGGACTVVPACSKSSCGNGVKCQDTRTVPAIPAGQYQCVCPAGSTYADNLRRCVDIDECKLGGVKAACGKTLCRNANAVTPKAPKAGATCGVKSFPFAPAPNSTWSGTAWQ